MHKRRIFLALSFTAWIASSSFADPTKLATANTQATPDLDSYVSQMWDDQQYIVNSLTASGLLNAADQHDHFHDHGTGMGGEYGNELSVLDGTDDIQAKIDEVSRQAQAKQDGLDKLLQPVTISKTYRSGISEPPVTLQTNLNISTTLAIEPIANARTSSQYGYRTMGGRGENHPGIDLAAPTGTPIYATGDGVVTRAGWVNGYGNFVEIDHGNGYITRYGHASRIFVSVGDQVTANQNIAAVGCTGRCTGPHLHYEVLKDGKRENPSTYLALAPKRDS